VLRARGPGSVVEAAAGSESAALLVLRVPQEHRMGFVVAHPFREIKACSGRE